MYYPDLTPYDYGITEYEDALNIGWLEMGHEFSSGDFPEKQELIRKLRAKKIENKYRGFHSCDFCPKWEIGNGEYVVQWNGKTYAAPRMVVHYIEAHNYKPPQIFIDAVINERENGTKI
jgi:hypothetical protein